MTDRRWWLWVSLGLIVLTSLPFLVVDRQVPSGYVPGQVYYSNAADWNVYYSYAQQATQGKLLVGNLMATDDPVQLFLPTFVVTGWIAKLTNLSVPVSFQLLRLLLIPVLVWLVIRYARFTNVTGVGLVLLTFFLVSGVGRAVTLPDFSPFTAILFSPHQLVAWIALVWALLSVRRGQWYWCAVALSLLFVTIPFAALVATAACVVSLARRSWKQLLFLLAGLLPVAAYLLWSSQFVSNQQYATHNAGLTLPPHIFVAGLLFLGSLAIVSWRQLRLLRSELLVLVAIGFAAGLFMLPYSQRLLFGLALPLSLLSAVTLQRLQRWVQRQWRWATANIVVGGIILIAALVGPGSVVLATVSESPRYAMTIDEAAIITWARTQPSARWLTSLRQGQFIAGQLGQAVFVGHAVQTPQAEQKQQLVATLLAGQLPATTLAETVREHRLTRAVLSTSTPVPQSSLMQLTEQFRTDSLVVYDLRLSGALVYSPQ